MGVFTPWFSDNGQKMELALESLEERVIAITHRANDRDKAVASMVITFNCLDCWRLEWVIQGFIKSQGCVFLNTEELMAAFGLSDVTFSCGLAQSEQFDADVAVPGHFIRKNNFLNIPCPGTGNRADKNLSLELDAKIKAAVQRLLDSVEAPQPRYFQHEERSYSLDPGIVGSEFLELDGQTFRVGEWVDGMPTDLVPITAASIQSI
jgi:hypothetical protein